MAALQLHADDGEADLEASIARGVAEFARAMRQLAAHPQSRQARRLAHLAGGHLEELRQAVERYLSSEAQDRAMTELLGEAMRTAQAGRPLGKLLLMPAPAVPGSEP